MRHSEQFCELYLFDHLPRDRLERRKREQQLGEPAARFVLPVADVIFEVSVDLLAHPSYAVRLVQALGIYDEPIKNKTIGRYTIILIDTLLSRDFYLDQKRRWL